MKKLVNWKFVKPMKHEFFDRVREGLIVDTRIYRYTNDCGVIRRIPLSYLDTVLANDRNNWELVAYVNDMREYL